MSRKISRLSRRPRSPNLTKFVSSAPQTADKKAFGEFGLNKDCSTYVAFYGQVVP
jgi:hypothetical protein